MTATITFTLDGREVAVRADGASLLEALRDRIGSRSAKDGCSPQGQCGCCTVLVDGQARVACVTPVARIAGRVVTTLEGMPADVRDGWADAFSDTGASQCGFCTPGIVMRLAALASRPAAAGAAEPADAVDQALLAHLCRCTGWQTIHEAAALVRDRTSHGASVVVRPQRDLVAAGARATLEGASGQHVAREVALGEGGFADDSAPADALVAVLGLDGAWVVAETLTEARRLAGKVQGRRTTAPLSWPVSVPEGDWKRTLQTTWVEPAYLEPDASWCVPGGQPASSLGNGGAFGGKVASSAAAMARQLADRHGRAVRVLFSREDVVRLGPKRPPMALGLRADGSGIVRVARTPGIAEAIAAVAPDVVVDQVDVLGPPTSAAIRAAGWAELAAASASLRPHGPDEVVAPNGSRASVSIASDGAVSVRVWAGEVLDAIVLRSYCIGAVHQAMGWVTSEAVSVDDAGRPLDLTIRSFGIVRAVDLPLVTVTIEAGEGPAINGSDAVFAASAAAFWRHRSFAARWPSTRS